MDEYSSSHAVIKALKGSTDPLDSGRLKKIEIARKSWESREIYFPNKEEVLAEWILSTLLKDKGSPSLILSAPYWSLLRDIIGTGSKQQTAARPSKAGILALLNRISTATIAASFFNSLSNGGGDEELVESFSQCVTVLWPLAIARVTHDVLTECFGSVLAFLTADSQHQSPLEDVCMMISRSFRHSLGNMSSKKKALSVFTKHHLDSWMKYLCKGDIGDIANKSLQSEVRQAGLDIVFSLEALKSPQDPLEAILRAGLITKNAPITYLQILPILYRAYVQETRKHRLAIFGSSSNQSQEQAVQSKVRDSCVRAFSVCYKALRDRGDDLEVWQGVLSLLEALDEAKAVSTGMSESTDVLGDIGVWATNALTDDLDSAGHQAKRNELALNIHYVLSRIDFDRISPLIKDIAIRLSTLNPEETPGSQILLHALLDFHSKTRTLPSYLAVLFECFSRSSLSHKYFRTESQDVRRVHRLCVSGALLNKVHLEEIGRAIKNFLTPGQTLVTAEAVLFAMSSSLGGDSDGDNATQVDTDASITGTETRASGGRHRKRRKVDKPIASFIVDDCSALSFALTARLAAVILPSLPLSTLSASSIVNVSERISSATKILLDTVQRVYESQSVPFNPPGWEVQVSTTAALRIRHALITSTLPSLDIQRSAEDKAFPVGLTAGLMASKDILPELFVELLRAFFDADYQLYSPEEQGVVITAMLDYLQSNILEEINEGGKSDTNGIKPLEKEWNGWSSTLDLSEPGAHNRGALAVWGLALERWIFLIDELGSKEQLERFAKLCLRSCSGGYARSSEITFHQTFDRAMHSAAFWELPKLRDALMSAMNETLEHVRWDEYPKLMKDLNTGKQKRSLVWGASQIRAVAATYGILLRAPKEYLQKSHRQNFIRLGLISDMAVSMSTLCLYKIKDQERIGSEDQLWVRIIIRCWLNSMLVAYNIVDLIEKPEEYLGYLSSLRYASREHDPAFRSSTTDLLANAYRQIIRAAIHGDDSHMQRVCELLRNETCADDLQSGGLVEDGFLQFIHTLVTEASSPKRLPQSSISVVTEFHSYLEKRYLLRINAVAYESNPEPLEKTHFALQVWRACLILQKWLSVKGSGVQHGRDLLRNLVIWAKESNSNEYIAGQRAFGTQVFGLLLEELQSSSPSEHESHLELILSAYILLLGRHCLADIEACDAALLHTVKFLPAQRFSFLLSLLKESFAKGLSTVQDLKCAVHLSQILVGDAPEGSSKVTQEYFEECLRLFVANELFVSGDIALSSKALGFIGSYCSDKPALLRLSSVGLIWVLLARHLTGTPSHTPKTHTDILHAIVGIAGALIRLRRDLVLTTLPHLVAVLRQLLSALRAVRPQLGAKQAALVTDTLPWWMARADPPGAEEARAVARLLTALQAKTVPRTFRDNRNAERDAGRDKQRAESLAHPFSKHAPYVLAAYVAALNDPLCTLPLAVRTELEPGLFVLCDVMSEHGRDAIMVSVLDAGGKVTLKALWREYDKQKYVGKG